MSRGASPPPTRCQREFDESVDATVLDQRVVVIPGPMPVDSKRREPITYEMYQGTMGTVSPSVELQSAAP